MILLRFFEPYGLLGLNPPTAAGNGHRHYVNKWA